MNEIKNNFFYTIQQILNVLLICTNQYNAVDKFIRRRYNFDISICSQHKIRIYFLSPLKKAYIKKN